MTYCLGTTYVCEKNVTMADLKRVCEILSSDSVDVEPEGISEGGVLFVHKDIKTKQYKSMRLCMNSHLNELRFPFLPCSDDTLLLKPKDQISTYLKAFYNSPSFTLDEVLRIESAFKEIGMIRKGKHPSNKALTQSKIR